MRNLENLNFVSKKMHLHALNGKKHLVKEFKKRAKISEEELFD